MALGVFAKSKLSVVSILKGRGSQKQIMDLNLDYSALLKVKLYFKNNSKVLIWIPSLPLGYG